MKTKPLILALSAAVLFCGFTFPVSAQLPVPPPVSDYQPLSDQQLDQLLGPIALYPDPLLAIILPAATLPTQIVLADRYVVSGSDPNQINFQPWDTSVQALAHYPSVLQYLDDNLAWTTEVGAAFLNQQQQVMESIQRLRISAQNFGNLQSTPQQQVVNEGGSIEILPAEPEVVYVPIYQPAVVYYQSGFSLGFSTACNIGPWLNCDFDWVHHDLRCWDNHHPRPGNWWHQRADQRTAVIAQQTATWHPQDHNGFDRADRANHGQRDWNNSQHNWPGAAATPEQIAQFRDRLHQQRDQQDQQHNNNNNTVVTMSHPGAVQRPMATPRPSANPTSAVTRDSGSFQLPNRPSTPFVPSANRGNTGSGNNGGFNGNDNSRDTRTFASRENSQPVVRTPPPPSQPVQSAPPVRSAPTHFDSPPPTRPTPPPAQNNGGGGNNNNNNNNNSGNNNGSGGGSHGGSSRR